MKECQEKMQTSARQTSAEEDLAIVIIITTMIM